MVDPITAAIVVVGALTAASFYQQRKMQRQAEKQANEMASHQISGHDSNRALYTVYGRALVGTTTLYKRVSRKQVPMANASFTNYRGGGGSPDTSDKRWGLNRFLYRISSLSNGPIDGIEKVLIDGESHLASRFTAGHSRHFEAAVSLGPTAGNYFSNLKTTYSTDFNQWDANKKGQGVAYVVERFWFDKSNPAYQGEPQTQYLVRGRKLYDPRLDSTVTGGSGTHRSATPSTWAFSDNPALALLDMLTNTEYGRGVDYSECDLPSFITAANKCDTYVDIPARATNQTGSELVVYDPHLGVTYEIADNGIIPNYRMDQITTGVFANKQKRFRLNMAVDNSKEVLDNIQQILQSFRANLHHINGEYAVHMDDVASPVITLNDDDIIGGLKISQGDRKQRINRMTAKFLNANKHYKTDQVSWPPLDETPGSQYQTYLTEDSGEKLHKTVTLTGCTDYYQAEDIAEYLVRESRVTLTATGTFGSRCFNLVPGDVVALNYDSAGYSGKYFIVDQVGVDISSMNVKLSLREYDSSIYTWNANRGNEPIGLFFDEEQQYNVTPTSPTIGTVSADSIALSDGTAALRLNIPFSDIPEEALSVEIGWSVQNADVYTSQVILDETATKAEFLIGIDDQVIDLRIRYFVANADGIQLPSGYTTTTFTLPAVSGTKLDNIEDNATRNQVFQQDAQPSGGAYQAGDIWIDTNDNFKMYMYDSGAWVLRADSRIATAHQDAAGAQSTADGKIDTFYQDDAPTSASEGDLWIDTNDDNKLYRHDGTNFQAARDSGIAEAIQDAATAQSTADGKITTFFAASTATPTAEGVGDMWYQTDNAVMQRWNGSTWNDVASYNTGELADLDEDDVLHEIPTEGLTHYWPCNSIADVSGGGNAELQEVVNGKTGIHAGASPTISTDSPTGKSFSNPHGSGFTLLNDTDADALEASNGFAWSIWFKSETSSGDSAGRIITRDASDGWAVAVNQSVSENQFVTLYGEGGTESMGSVAQGEWHHFCLSSDGSGTGGTPATISGYVNGELVSTEAYTPVTSSRPVVIGCNAESAIALTSTGKFVGKFTEIRAYNRALSAQEVRGLYKVPAASAPAQVDGDIIIDGSLVANKLTIANLADISDNAGTITGGSVGGITITSAELYAGQGNWAATDTGFYLDNTGKFSLKDKFLYNPSDNLLTVDGNITADVITAKENLVVLGDLEASSMAAGSITRAMFSQDALDEIYGALATSVGGSNGDYKEASGSFTASGGTVTVGTSSDKFDHGTADVEVEFLSNHFFYATTNYTTAQAQATLNFEVSADGTFTDLTSATKTHTLQYIEYDLSSYYGYTYLVYYFNGDVSKTFTTGTGNDLPDSTNLQFRVRVTGVGTAFTGQTVPFTVEANEGVTGVVSTGGNADYLDNLDSTKFLRSDVDDTFDADLTITGDLSLQGALNITGDINSYSVTDLDVVDKTITVNAGNTQALSDGAGLIVDRNTATAASLTWNETNDLFELNFPAKITKSTINAPALHLYHDYDAGYRDTLLIETPYDRDAGLTIKTAGGQYEMWVDSNGDDSLIFSAGDTTADITMELYQNKNVDIGGNLDVAGEIDTSKGLTFNPNGFDINGDSDGNRTLFTFKRNASASWQIWHTANQDLDFVPNNTAYKLQWNGNDVWHRGDLTDTDKGNYDTAYTYSQVGHLPLAGGTVTGTLEVTQNLGDASIYINSSRPTLAFTDTNSFTDANDMYIIRGHTDNLQFQWYDDSEGSTSTSLTLASTGAATFTSTVDWSGGSSTNANTAYTYSQVGHLPLTGGTITGDTNFTENDKLSFGTDNDFKIYHAGTTYLDNTSGNLYIRNLADDMDIRFESDDGSGGTKTYLSLDGSTDTLKAQTKFQVLPGNNRTNGFHYTAANTISNQNHTMMLLDFNFSGTETHTTDNYKYGLYIDYDSSDSGGDTSNETRLFPLYVDARNLADGTADRLDAAYLYARQNGSANMAALRGLFSYGLALNSGGTVASMYGSHSQATAQSSGTGEVTNAYGALNQAVANSSSGTTIAKLVGAANITSTQSGNTSDITHMYGSWNEVQLDATNNAHTISNMYAVYALIDENDTGTDHTVNNSYLFYGDYQGNLQDSTFYPNTNAYGVFIADDVPSQFNGRVRAKEFDVNGALVIDNNRAATLTGIKHDNTSDLVIDLDDNTYVKINNPDGVEAIKIGGGGSTDAKNTYSNDIHRFYKADGTYELAQFYQGMADFYENDVQGEGFYMSALDINGAASGDTYFTGGTASQRRLTITTSDVGANANAKHTFKVGSASGQMVFGNNTTADLLTVATGGITVNGSVTADSIVVDGIERIESDGDFIANNLTVAGNFTMTTGSIGVNGNLSANFGYVLAGTSSANGFWVGSNQIVEGDTRNLKNIGTVDSGAITSTGTSSFANIDIGGDGLTSTDDLDSLTDGFYKWSNSQPSNSPGYAYFNLFQMTDPNQKIQLAWGGSSGGRLFVRRADSGAFYSWTEFFSTYHPPTLAEVTSGGNTTINNITVGTITSGAITSSGQVTTAGSITAGNASTTLGYYVGATQVIQGSTRNLVNIGTILSGAITSTGTGTFNNSVLFTDTDITSMNTGIKTLNNGGLSIALDEDDEVASTDFRVRIDRSSGDSQLVLDASGNLDVEGRGTFNELTLTGDSDNLTINEAAGDWTINNAQQNNGITIYDGSSGVVINYNGSGVAQFDGGGGMDLLSGNLQINGVSRITAAGNATLGTISSGAVTASGNIRLNKEGTADASNQIYASRDLEFLASGWDTNNNVARDVMWKVRNVPTASVYPDHDLQFIESDQGSDYIKFQLHGRGSNNHTDPLSATFFGNVSIEAGSGTNAGDGDLEVADAISGGRFKLGATTIIDGSANMSNIGTISSGNITSSGTVTANSVVVDGIERIESDGDVIANNLTVAGNFTMTTGSIGVNGNLSANFGYVLAGTSSANGYWVGSNQIVEGDTRNLKNIGTISSGAITSTGASSFGTITSGAIDATGNSEFDKIDIVNTNQTEMLRIRADDTISNTDFNALFIDHNCSGSEAHTGDNTHRSILVDLDSSATGGDTSNEHRVRGIEANVRVTGDSDAVYGVFGYAEGQNGASTVSEVVGVYGQAVADEHTAGRVSNAYALRGVAYGYGQGTGDITAFFGTHSKVHLTTSQDKNCGSLHGGFFDVETDDPGQAQTVNNIFGVRATWDDDSGGNVTAANAYLFYGGYEGTNNVSGGKYGVLIVSDCENRFAGTVRTNSEFNVSGTTVVNSDRNGIFTAIKHDNTLDVVIDLDNNTYTKINNPDGDLAISIGGGGNTDLMNRYINDIHRFRKADDTTDLAEFMTGSITLNEPVSADVLYSDEITLSNGAPSTTTNKLYNVGGALYFNGSTVNQATAFNNLTGKTSGTGDYKTTGKFRSSDNIRSGEGSGGVALTINDGYGNANVTFNHEDGVPEQDGNAARIEVNTDSSSAATMYFEVKSDVTDGLAVQTDAIFQADGSGIAIASGKTLRSASGELTLQANDVDFVIQDTTDSITNFIWRDFSASKLYLGTADAQVELRSHLTQQSGFNITTPGVLTANSVVVNGIERIESDGDVIANNLTVAGNLNMTTGSIGVNGNLSANFGYVLAGTSSANGYWVGSNQIVEGDTRNLKNIGTIVAGGKITSTELTITGGTDVDDIYINNTSPTLAFTDSNSFSDANDKYIVRGASTGKLQFQWHDNSANTTTQTFLIDESGNADFEGTITSNGSTVLTSASYDTQVCHLKSNVNAAIAQGAANEFTVDFNLEEHSDSTTFSHSSGVVTVATTGWYKVYANMVYANASSSARNTVRAYVEKNGSEIVSTRTYDYDRGSSYGKYSNNKIETMLYLTANDTVSIGNYAYNEDGICTIEAAECEFIVSSVSVQTTSTNADTVDGLHASSFIRSDANDTATGEVTFTSDIYMNQYLRHTSNAGTNLRFEVDRVRITAGNVEMIDCVEGTSDYVDIIDSVRVKSRGDLECAGNITAYSTTSISDINQKTNIQAIQSPIEKIKAISGYEFDWKQSGEHSGGVIAQEVEQIMPNIVKETSIRDSETMKSVDYQAIIGLLVETVKDLNKRIEELEDGNN